MSYTPDQLLDQQTSGAADWDTALNANFAILDRGYHIVATAGSAVSSGQACVVNSAAYVIPYNANSMSLREAHLIAYRSVASGEASQFLVEGTVRSMTVWSGFITPGQPVYVSATSPGFLVSSYTGAGYPVGLALGTDAVLFKPGMFQAFPRQETITVSVGPVIVGSQGNFALTGLNRGIVRTLQVNAQSSNAHKIRLWSGSARVASELLYETLTHSTSAGSVDITSLGFTDQALFPIFNTDTTSPLLTFGRIDVQSGCSVNSSHFSISLTVERFR